MGTSTVHRSPSTGRWRYVESMYRESGVDRARLLSEVLNAASTYTEGLSDAAVLVRLGVLLDADRVAALRAEDPVLAATNLVTEAQTAGRLEGHVSFYGDLADRALFATILSGVQDAALVDEPSAAVTSFARELIGFAVDHLVSRDATKHLGGSGLPTASAVLSVRGETVEAARQLVDRPEFRERATAIVEAREDAWRSLVSAALTAGRDLRSSE